MPTGTKLTQEEVIARAKLVHGDRYDYSKFVYKNSKTKSIIICKKHGEFLQSTNNHLSKHNQCGCPKCCNMYSKEEYVVKANKIHHNFYDYSKLNYTHSWNKDTIVCPKHGEFLQTPVAHLRGDGCPSCGLDKRRMTKEDFTRRTYEVHLDTYDYSRVEFINAYTKVKIICREHGEFSQTPQNHLYGKNGCPHCRKSIGENDIKAYLTNNNVKFIQEYRFDDCVSKRRLPFDFYLPDNNVAIEYQGQQHFIPVEAFGGLESHLSCVARDTIKREYCLKHNIRLIEIRYDERIQDRLVAEGIIQPKVE